MAFKDLSKNAKTTSNGVDYTQSVFSRNPVNKTGVKAHPKPLFSFLENSSANTHIPTNEAEVYTEVKKVATNYIADEVKETITKKAFKGVWNVVKWVARESFEGDNNDNKKHKPSGYELNPMHFMADDDGYVYNDGRGGYA